MMHEIMLIFLSQAESYQVNAGLQSHGYSGPVKVSLGGHYDISAQQFVEIGPKVERDRLSSDECNTMGADSINVFVVSTRLFYRPRRLLYFAEDPQVSKINVPFSSNLCMTLTIRWTDRETGKRQGAAVSVLFEMAC